MKDIINMFYVAGGEFTNTSFTRLKDNKIDVLGPFETYDEAQSIWRGRSQTNVDDCHNRYYICDMSSVKDVFQVGSNILYNPTLNKLIYRK